MDDTRLLSYIEKEILVCNELKYEFKKKIEKNIIESKRLQEIEIVVNEKGNRTTYKLKKKVKNEDIEYNRKAMLSEVEFLKGSISTLIKLKVELGL